MINLKVLSFIITRFLKNYPDNCAFPSQNVSKHAGSLAMSLANLVASIQLEPVKTWIPEFSKKHSDTSQLTILIGLKRVTQNLQLFHSLSTRPPVILDSLTCRLRPSCRTSLDTCTNGHTERLVQNEISINWTP